MTPLITQIEDGIVAGRNQWMTEDSMNIDALLEALRLRGIVEDDQSAALAEGAITCGFLDAKRAYGGDWHWQTGSIAEYICANLVVAGLVTTGCHQPD